MRVSAFGRRSSGNLSWQQIADQPAHRERDGDDDDEVLEGFDLSDSLHGCGSLDVIPVIPHRRLVALLDHSFAHRLAVSPSGFGELASPPLRGFLIESVASDLAKDTLALHLPLEHAKRRIDVVVADENQHVLESSFESHQCAASSRKLADAHAVTRCYATHQSSEAI